ncbi:hypothetical protein [uncultured Draconibacterium sp.]|uniref:hypothetical protein n=1 Tax=uncultured Draconibacterium sp. TaxID=1573823 RepID=UPI0029C68C67|nr:hypothetical protein [uncultured Draconibacterium sp.]
MRIKLAFFGFFLLSTFLAYAQDNASFEFKRGDILVKPNNNWLPGTEFVENGNNFGHAVIVLKGAKGDNVEELLKEIVVFESHSRDVSEEYQIREVRGFVEGADWRISNDSFKPKNAGKRYRLRAELPPEKMDAVIEYILAQDNDVSSWRSIKNTSNVAKDKHYWYCTLILYQAFKDVLGIDLDANGGLVVFPNDVIRNSLFDHKNGRVVF